MTWALEAAFLRAEFNRISRSNLTTAMMKALKSVRLPFLRPCVALGAFFLWSAASAYSAVDIRVDYGDQTVGVPATWNTIDTGTLSSMSGDLTDFATGTANTEGVQTTGGFSFGGDFDATNGGPTWNGGADKDWIDNDTADDYILAGGIGSTLTLTFSSLDGSAYDVEVLTAVQNSASLRAMQDIQVGGAFADSDANGTLSAPFGDGWLNRTEGWFAQNYLIWNAVAPSSGNIVITFDGSPSSNVPLVNAVRISTHVPFHTHALPGLAALAALVCIRRCRRKRAQA